MTWQPCTEERYYEMLGVLPPALWLYYGFLVGEPFDHRECTITKRIAATYAAFVEKNGSYFEGPNLTTAEFKSLDLSAIV